MLQIDTYIFFDKNINGRVVQLEEHEMELSVREPSLQGTQNCIRDLAMKLKQKDESETLTSTINIQ